MERRKFLQVNAALAAAAVTGTIGCDKDKKKNKTEVDDGSDDNIVIDSAGDVMIAVGGVIAGIGAVPIGITMILVGTMLKVNVRLSQNRELKYQRKLTQQELNRVKDKSEVQVTVTRNALLASADPDGPRGTEVIAKEKVPLQRQ